MGPMGPPMGSTGSTATTAALQPNDGSGLLCVRCSSALGPRILPFRNSTLLQDLTNNCSSPGPASLHRLSMSATCTSATTAMPPCCPVLSRPTLALLLTCGLTCRSGLPRQHRHACCAVGRIIGFRICLQQAPPAGTASPYLMATDLPSRASRLLLVFKEPDSIQCEGGSTAECRLVTTQRCHVTLPSIGTNQHQSGPPPWPACSFQSLSTREPDTPCGLLRHLEAGQGGPGILAPGPRLLSCSLTLASMLSGPTHP